MRFPAPDDLPTPPDPVPHVGPVAFCLRFDAAEYCFDLSHLPCPRLVRALARAASEIGGDDGTLHSIYGFRSLLVSVEMFVGFVGAAEPAEAAGLSTADLEPELFDAFEYFLIAKFPEDSGRPSVITGHVMRLLRAIHAVDADSFGIEMQGRVGFTTNIATMPASKPLDAYPMPVFERIEAAALEDVRAIRDRILRGERIAERGENPETAGWGRLENVLWHIAHIGPLTAEDRHRRPQVERLGGIRQLNSHLFLTQADLVPLLALLICQTGLEPECAKSLTTQCLVNPARGFVSIAYVKRRAHGHTNKTMRVSDGGALHHPGGLIRLALRLTQRGREFTGSDAIWHAALDNEVRALFRRGRAHVARHAAAWIAKHGIDQMADRGGGPVSMDMRRLRKSHKSRNYLRAGGILDDFVAGHTKEVAAAHYADLEAHREVHEQAVENGLQQALDAALAPPLVLDEDGARLDDGDTALEPQEVRAALNADNDVWLASCRDFYDSPWALKKGSGCPVAVWGCLECPNAVFTTRHLPSLLSFLSFLESQREGYSTAEWTARHGLAWERIVLGIRPKFSTEQIATAAAIAEAAGPRLSLPARLLELTT